MPNAKLKVYHSQEFCTQIFFYYNTDGIIKAPFPLPDFMEKQLVNGGWVVHGDWDIGHVNLSPVDWVDQTGDYSHFNQLHNTFLFPWTNYEIPILSDYVGIWHQMDTFIGKKWKSSYGVPNDHYVYFTTQSSVTWKGKIIEGSTGNTMKCLWDQHL
eukprot:UN24286